MILEGEVEAELPQGLYTVRASDGRRFTASLPAKSRHGMVGLIQGDRVKFEVSPVDTSRARILSRA